MSSRFIDKFKQIQAIGIDTKIPWEVKRVTGIKQLSIMGDQICLGGEDCDYVSLDEARLALEILTKELGGTIKWQK